MADKQIGIGSRLGLVVFVALILAINACSSEENSGETMSDGDRGKPSSSSTLGTLSVEPGDSDSQMRVRSEQLVEKAKSGEVLAVIVRVDEENYIPEGVNPMTTVNPYLFTARLQKKQILELETDEHVVAIEISEKLR